MQNPAFQNDGLLLIVFDEAASSDTTHGGGHVAMVLVGTHVKRGYRQASSTVYQYEALLRLSMKVLGLATDLGAASTAPDMDEFFN